MFLLRMSDFLGLHVRKGDHFCLVNSLILKKAITIFDVFQLHPLHSVGPVVVNDGKACNAIIH